MKMYTFTINEKSIFKISAENINNAIDLLKSNLNENDKIVLDKINNKGIE